MSTAYTPREGSTAWKVINFLNSNPEEKLDADVISAKYDCTRANVHTLLGPAVQAGLIDRNEDLASGDLVYTAKMPHPAATGFKGWLERNHMQSAEGRAPRSSKDSAGTPPPVDVKSPRKSPSKAFRMDLSAIAIEKGVPLPAGKAPQLDWFPLCDRLMVGDSFQLPAEARSSISSYATKFKRDTNRVLSIRVVPEGVRVWRTK